MWAQLICTAGSLLLYQVSAFPAPSGDMSGSLSGLDDGLQWKFADVEVVSGEVFTGQIVGVYNEAKFMWNPSDHSTLSIFTSSNAQLGLEHFSVTPGEDPAIFDLTTDDIVTVKLRDQPGNLVEYQQFMRQHGYVFENVPAEGEIWISCAWDKYHAWEDGRGNYAWDFGALNTNMMSYSNYGTRNTDFTIWGRNVLLPMGGKVVTVMRNEVDNTPDINAAVEMEDHTSGSDVDLEEKPQNIIELQIGGDTSPFLLRLIHFRRNTIPNTIRVGQEYAAGTYLGQVGNSGTTLVPHLHVVFGFTDANNRFWSLPVEWSGVSHRRLMAYPAGYQYGPYHQHQYLYPKNGWLVSNS